MLLKIPDVLTAAELEEMRKVLRDARWEDGRATAGGQAVEVKNNEQLPLRGKEEQALQPIVLAALSRHAGFYAAALPRRALPPMFNRYGGAMNAYGNHIDKAIRFIPDSAQRLRADISCTLFLTDPQDYDGGELAIEDGFGPQRVKLAAGSLVLYPAGAVHRVEPVTRGQRLASIVWIESMVRSAEQRRLLYDMDRAIVRLREREGSTDESVALAGTYHNLLRMWADA